MADIKEDLDTYRKKYPNENGVYLNHKQQIIIEHKGDSLSVASSVFEEIFWLRENSVMGSKNSLGFSYFNPLTHIEARTLVPNGKRYKTMEVSDFITSDLRDSYVFHDDYKSVSFIFPAVTAGAKTQMEYNMLFREIRLLNGFFFNNVLPVENTELSITCPSDVELGFQLYNCDSTKIIFRKTIKHGKTTYCWKASNLRKINFEEDAPNIRFYIPHIVYYIKQYNNSTGQPQTVLQSTRDLHNWYYSLVEKVNHNDNHTRLKALTDSITVDAKTDYDKVKSIYYWVQNHIKYVAFEDGLGGFVPRSAEKVYNYRYGDCKDMANLLTVLINLSGVKAYLAWIGTRDIPYRYEDLPSPNVDNHVVAAWPTETGYQLLDATGGFLPMGYPSSFIQDKEALISFGPDKYEVYTVPEIAADRNKRNDTMQTEIEGSCLKGTGLATFTGYQKIRMNNALTGETRAEQLKTLNNFSKGSNKFQVNDFEIRNLNERDSNLTIRYNFRIDDYVRINNDELYVNLVLDKFLFNEKISTQRVYDLERDFKSFNASVVKLTIPEGYTVEYMPESIVVNNDLCNFEIKYKQNGQQLEMDFNVSVNFLVLHKNRFDDWNRLMIKLRSACNEAVILKKKNNSK